MDGGPERRNCLINDREDCESTPYVPSPHPQTSLSILVGSCQHFFKDSEKQLKNSRKSTIWTDCCQVPENIPN
jgi:hypothetical protein